MLGTWELFALTPSSSSPPTHKKEKGAPSLLDTTSHWLHENSITKIGCLYFWPGLIALPKNTLPKMMKTSNNNMKSIFISTTFQVFMPLH
jgi:hypothetical protein